MEAVIITFFYHHMGPTWFVIEIRNQSPAGPSEVPTLGGLFLEFVIFKRLIVVRCMQHATSPRRLGRPSESQRIGQIWFDCEDFIQKVGI